MIFLILSGLIGVIFGVFLLLMPESLKQISSRLNRLVSDLDSLAYRYKQGIGACLLLSGATLLFIAYYLFKTR